MSTEIKKHFASFAEAIREGAKLRPQCFGTWFDGTGTCAVGAAYEVTFGTDQVGHALDTLWPYINEGEVWCPECVSKQHLCGIVVHLNDNHRWTRERIAEFVEQYEERLGFVTVLDTQDTCGTRDNNLSHHSPASDPKSESSESKFSFRG